MRDRPSRFVLEPRDANDLRHALIERWPMLADEAAAAGNRVLAGRYDLLAFRDLRFGSDASTVDWHFDPVHDRRMPVRFSPDIDYLDPAFGDHKIIWELNRHQHWLGLGRAAWLTGDRAYGDRIVTELQSWLAANPPRTGSNWSSMLELAFRAQSWLWAMHFLLAESNADDRGPWLVDLLVGIDAQLTHVEQNLSYYFSPNTHLTGEVLALYVAGVALPELARSAQWIDIGRRVLLAETEKQIEADGGHAERSTHYHRYTLDFYVLALLTAERAGDIDAAAVFTEAVTRLATFMRAIADDRGWIPQIGDDDGGMLWPIAGRDPRDVRDSLALAAAVLDRPALAPWGVTEEAFWIAWHGRQSSLRASRPDRVGVADARYGRTGVHTDLLGETGYVVMRNAAGDHLVFDVGPHGFLNGGHAHADALAVTLTVGSRPLLIDPGTATYTMNRALRDRMRDGAAHNTITLDGVSSARPRGPFHWSTVANSEIEISRSNPRLACAVATHDGFGPVRHRRTIVHTLSGGWLIVDDIVGDSRHTADAHWHFDREWSVSAEMPGTVCAVAADGARIWLLHDAASVHLAHGDEESGLGWCSPRYGALFPTWSARLTQSAPAPFSIATWVGAAEPIPPSLTRLLDEGTDATTVVVRCGAMSIVTSLHHGGAPGDRSRDVAGYRTDGRLLQHITGGRARIELSVADATHATSRDGLLSVDGEAPIADVHAIATDERVELWASHPLPRLTIEGTALTTARTVCLNGREIPIVRSPRDHSFTVIAADWSDAPRGAFTDLNERTIVCAE